MSYRRFLSTYKYNLYQIILNETTDEQKDDIIKGATDICKMMKWKHNGLHFKHAYEDIVLNMIGRSIEDATDIVANIVCEK